MAGRRADHSSPGTQSARDSSARLPPTPVSRHQHRRQRQPLAHHQHPRAHRQDRVCWRPSSHLSLRARVLTLMRRARTSNCAGPTPGQAAWPRRLRRPALPLGPVWCPHPRPRARPGPLSVVLGRPPRLRWLSTRRRPRRQVTRQLRRAEKMVESPRCAAHRAAHQHHRRAPRTSRRFSHLSSPLGRPSSVRPVRLRA